MFGKTKELIDTEEHHDADLVIDDFFGDEAAVAEAMRVEELHQRVTQVEQQISSQFTSMAAYAQIAQEQIELVRSEAQHANERSEGRVIGLIERERADRIAASDGTSSTAPSQGTSRLDSLEAQITEIRDSLQQCLANQKALADAIIDLFQPNGDQRRLIQAAGEVDTPSLEHTTVEHMTSPIGMPEPMPAPLTTPPSPTDELPMPAPSPSLAAPSAGFAAPVPDGPIPALSLS